MWYHPYCDVSISIATHTLPGGTPSNKTLVMAAVMTPYQVDVDTNTALYVLPVELCSSSAKPVWQQLCTD